MWYLYNQNNSGGNFVVNDAVGHYVLIEADSNSEADFTADLVGIYFDGCDYGRDCDCCGDRWVRAWRGNERPEIYGDSVYTFQPTLWGSRSVIYLYHKNGRKECITHTPAGVSHESDRY